MLKCSICVLDRRTADGFGTRTSYFKNFQQVLEWVDTLKLPLFSQLLVEDGGKSIVFPVVMGEIQYGKSEEY